MSPWPPLSTHCKVRGAASLCVWRAGRPTWPRRPAAGRCEGARLTAEAVLSAAVVGRQGRAVSLASRRHQAMLYALVGRGSGGAPRHLTRGLNKSIYILTASVRLSARRAASCTSQTSHLRKNKNKKMLILLIVIMIIIVIIIHIMGESLCSKAGITLNRSLLQNLSVGYSCCPACLVLVKSK